MLSPTYHLRGDYHTRAYEHVKSLPRSRRLRPADGLPYILLRNLLRLLALRPVCGAPRFDRNLSATGCLSLSLPVPLGELTPDKSALLSPHVPPCPSLSVKENDYEQRRSQVRVLTDALVCSNPGERQRTFAMRHKKKYTYLQVFSNISKQPRWYVSAFARRRSGFESPLDVTRT